MLITPEYFLSEALQINEQAEARGIQLRILGSLAFRIHCPKFVYLLDQMERELTDIDYMGLSVQQNKYPSFMLEMGYEMDKDLLLATEGSRYFFENHKTGLGVDIFVDKLDYCHPIWMKDRLELDAPTVTLIDLLMEKMQIVEINAKNFKDTFVLLLEHELGKDDREKIDIDYLSKVLGNDWGFYYTFILNLQKCKEFLSKFDSLDFNQKTEINQKIDDILLTIESSSKSLRWRLRSKIGTKMKWYRDVNEKDHTF